MQRQDDCYYLQNQEINGNYFPTIRQLASVIGSVIFLFPAVLLGKLHYRALEKDKSVALKKASGYFDKVVAKIVVKAIEELNWGLT